MLTSLILEVNFIISKYIYNILCAHVYYMRNYNTVLFIMKEHNTITAQFNEWNVINMFKIFTLQWPAGSRVFKAQIVTQMHLICL